jgi:acyl-CoA synthetase (AMP-forming)/AMP-acid ligase II
MSFGTLVGRSQRIAATIRDMLQSISEPVGVCAGAHLSSVVALLAVLDSGRPYVPLDRACFSSRPVPSLIPQSCRAPLDRL